MTTDPAGEPGAGLPVALRPAATVMLVRDGRHPAEPLEVLMVRRNLRSDFVGGAYVFPGGGVDPDDGGAGAAALASGLDDAEASRILGLGSGGLAYWVAAVRECFEEAGVLLAYDGGGAADHGDAAAPGAPTRTGTAPDPGTAPALLRLGSAAAERFARHRADVNAGSREFLDVCRDEGLSLALDRIHYFAHWVTPEGAPRRYDTRFFVAGAPPGQEPAHDAAETVEAGWIRPADALARSRDGEIELIFPTIRTLQAIGRFATSSELLAAAAAAGRVPVVVPRVVVDGRGERILLPGDPGYEDAGASGLDPADVDRAVRAASRAALEEPRGGGTP